MKRVFFAVCVAALAVPLCAQQEDSPLVRAAKASSHVTKKAKMVITNDTLVHTGGHIATTDVTTPIKLNPDYGLPGEYAKTPATTAATPAAPASGAMPVSKPPTVTSSQPPPAPTSQITTTTTTTLSTTGTTQPTVAPVQPPQPPQ
jgi:hypothetical protein